MNVMDKQSTTDAVHAESGFLFLQNSNLKKEVKSKNSIHNIDLSGLSVDTDSISDSFSSIDCFEKFWNDFCVDDRLVGIHQTKSEQASSIIHSA